MPHWPGPEEIARRKRATIELFPKTVSWCKAEKICQKRVNTRQNGSTRRPLRFGHQSRAPAHSIVVSSSFLGCAFSRLDVSQKCSQLIHMRFAAASPAGLRLEIRCETDKKKINFIFNCGEKIFLTRKRERACPTKGNKQCVSRKFSREPNRNPFGIPTRTDLAARLCVASPS